MMFYRTILIIFVVVVLVGHCCQATNELVAVTQIFRHGERTPVVFVVNRSYSDQSYWEAPFGHLTHEGKRQHHRLGQYTKQRYKDFIPPLYDYQEFYIETSDIDRTHMSAQANVAGMFPPTNSEIWNENLLWQPIPIHPADKDVIPIIPDCPTFFVDSAKVALDEKYLPEGMSFYLVYRYLRNHTGLPITSPVTAHYIYDELYLENIKGYPLPEWTELVFPEPLTTIASYTMNSLGYTDNQKKLACGRLLHSIITDFELIWTNQSKPKFHVYSGHDTNLGMILHTFGNYDNKLPNFASAIYFEMRNKSGDPIINVWYKTGENDDDMKKIRVLNCSFDCPLPIVKKKLEPFLVDKTEWDVLCENNTAYFKDDPTFFTNFLADLFELVHDEIVDYATYTSGKSLERVKRKRAKIDYVIKWTEEKLKKGKEKEKAEAKRVWHEQKYIEENEDFV